MAKLIKSKIENLTPDDHNFNKGSEYGNHLIEKSFREFGAGRSILIDRNNRIIAGNKSIEAASSIGMENVVIVETTGDEIVAVKRTDIDLDSKKGRELALADNATNKANLDFDEEEISKLSEQFEFDASDWGIDLGIDVEVEEAELSEDEKQNIEKRCNLGDVWKLGNHRLMCGDSTKESDVAQLMNNEKADLLLTDPPYNVDYQGATKDKMKIANDNMSDVAFVGFLTAAFNCAIQAMRSGAAFYVWHADSKGFEFRTALKEVGLTLRETLIWVKNSIVLGRQDYQWQHEPCLYGWKDGAAHYFIKDRSQSTVIFEDKPTRNDIHPTMKPVELMARLIKNSSQCGWLVLDLFGGSGSTLIACEQTGRKCYTMEFDPKYCDAILDRWEKLTGLKAELVESKTKEDGTM